MKILAGEIPHDAGEMRIQQKAEHFKNPKEARARGVTFIHQELNLCTNLTVAQNIYMGREYTKKGLVVDYKTMREKSQALIESLGFDIDVSSRLGQLSTAQQQVVEIAKALSYRSKILIMDEPTASLTSQEINQLFSLVRKMRDEGMGIIFISHRMDEVETIADRVTVMKDGATVGVMTREEFTAEKAVQMMVGRTLTQIYRRTHTAGAEKVLEVKNFRVGPRTVPFDLHLRRGEILGIGGLVGADARSLPRRYSARALRRRRGAA
jgi:ABC-type sugar transport system ATPase subunit